MNVVLAAINANEVGIPKVIGNGSTLNAVVGTVYVVIGAIAMFYIIRAALLYVTSGSDPGSVRQARETILYALIALGASTVVFAVVNFVISNVGGTG